MATRFGAEPCSFLPCCVAVLCWHVLPSVSSMLICDMCLILTSLSTCSCPPLVSRHQRMPSRRRKETLEEVRERLTREQRQRTAARIGELTVQTLQNTARQRLSDLACENYLTAARNRRQQEQAPREASANPASCESTSLVLLCLLLWALVANALLVHYIYTTKRQVKRACITYLVYACEILHICLSNVGLIMDYPTSTPAWVKMDALEVLPFPPAVGQKIWSMTRGEVAKTDGSVGHTLHIGTVTSVSHESLGLQYEDGESCEVMMATFGDDVTFHNGLVRTRLEKIRATSGLETAATSLIEVVVNPANCEVEPPVSVQANIEKSQESPAGPRPIDDIPGSGSPHANSGPSPDPLSSPEVLPESVVVSTVDEPKDISDETSNTTNPVPSPNRLSSQQVLEKSVVESTVEENMDISETTSNTTIPPPPPPPMLDLELLLPKSVAEVTVERAGELLKAAKALARLHKKREREELEGEFSLVGALKKKLKRAVEEKNEVKLARAKLRAQAKLAKARQADDCLWDDVLPSKPVKHKYTRLDTWQLGNKAARERKDEQLKGATVPTLTDARLQLMAQGWAIMDDWPSLCDDTCRPTQEQADYILQTNEDNKHVIFENAVLHDFSSVIGLDTKRDKLGGRARMQLKPTGHSGPKGRGYVEYQRKYKRQLECIIRGMFKDEEAGDPNAWQLNFNSIVGGVCHQHPHCDAGRVGTYHGLSIFPFVALHGFGIHPFSVWVLPPGFEYGFMHTFRADQILFMRGDFVHAGVPSTIPRGHMEFYPLHAGGWERRFPFWLRGATDSTFPWQTPSFPFAYPDVGTPNELGHMALCYPVATTEALQLPLRNETPCVPKKTRIAMKKRMSAQLLNY